jgi:hypothetical protein
MLIPAPQLVISRCTTVKHVHLALRIGRVVSNQVQPPAPQIPVIRSRCKDFLTALPVTGLVDPIGVEIVKGIGRSSA